MNKSMDRFVWDEMAILVCFGITTQPDIPRDQGHQCHWIYSIQWHHCSGAVEGAELPSPPGLFSDIQTDSPCLQFVPVCSSSSFRCSYQPKRPFFHNSALQVSFNKPLSNAESMMYPVEGGNKNGKSREWYNGSIHDWKLRDQNIIWWIIMVYCDMKDTYNLTSAGE